MVEIVQTPTESPVEAEAEIEEVEADEESEAVDDAMELVEPELPPGPKPTRPDSVHDTEMWSKPISCLFLVKANCPYFSFPHWVRFKISYLRYPSSPVVPSSPSADFDSNNAQRLILPALETAISDSKLLTRVSLFDHAQCAVTITKSPCAKARWTMLLSQW